MPSSSSSLSSLDDVSMHGMSEYSRARCGVYADLWYHGWTITSGHQFGGDYLLYTTLPSFVHSSYIVHVLPSWEHGLTTVDMVAMTRLANLVNKSILLAAIIPHHGTHDDPFFAHMHTTFAAPTSPSSSLLSSLSSSPPPSVSRRSATHPFPHLRVAYITIQWDQTTSNDTLTTNHNHTGATTT